MNLRGLILVFFWAQKPLFSRKKEKLFVFETMYGHGPEAYVCRGSLAIMTNKKMGFWGGEIQSLLSGRNRIILFRTHFFFYIPDTGLLWLWLSFFWG
nr:hypothetical protein [Acetobacter malorum]